ncbi:MAG: hypothetical protein JNL85_05250 [Rubrivivax sp.]|nr:hypothetical protein [Rubrivivax sp.]
MQLPALVGRYFEANVGRRLYIQVDKPLYKPGETIWFKAWDLTASSLSGPLAAAGGVAAEPKPALVELVSPKGAVVMKKRIRATTGGAAAAAWAGASRPFAASPSGGTTNDFELPAEAQGGEYTLRATTADGQRAERAIIVSAYEAPRLKKKLEFVKKAYGAGDLVSATVEVKRPTGEPLANKALAAVVTVDGVELPRVKFTSNAEGSAVVKFELPKTIAAGNGEGLLTILVEDGGVTESISKSIPILQKKLALAFFPEGGQMVAGLPTRLYFEAKTPLGKPADVEGRIVDDLGNTVATFGSHKNGLGRLEFTPATGRSYRAEVMRPAGVDERYALPLAEASGCVLRSYDDLDGELTVLRVGVRCSEKQMVIVSAMQRERLLDTAMVEAGPGAPAVVHLAAGLYGNSAGAQMQRAAGVARITLFNQQLDPLAERLVFRNRRARLQVSAELDKKRHSPRDEVEMTITTRDPATGRPVPAELALSVVDDTVVSFADDKSGHLLSKLLLEPELPGKVEEPNFYLDLTEAKSALALDLLMGTRGYRRFEWAQVLRPPLDVAAVATAAARGGGIGAVDEMRALRMMPAPPMAMPAQAPMAMPAQAPMARVQAVPAAQPAVPAARPAEREGERLAADADFARAAQRQRRANVAGEEPMAWAPVRVFPIPAFKPAGHTGPRDDFRETVLWVPALRTNGRGKAQVKFTLSDAVTSFRVFAEGVGGGMAGRSETVFKSTLPFSLAAKLPLEISAGDKPLIPITLSNDSERALDVKLDARFGALLKTVGEGGGGGNASAADRLGSLAAGQRRSLFVPLEVTGVRGTSEVRLSAAAAGLSDDVLRSIAVVPLGYPQSFERSGQITGQGGKPGQVNHDVDLSTARPGSAQARITVYTSTLSTTMAGLSGMLREPSGCFEQTSSTNYPNVMIMQYLKQHDVADPALLERSSKLMDSGYKKLAGYESPKQGYEWFGGDPGHEALTAYGLMQFADMKDVYGAVDSAMLARTAAWLKSRRDGQGGYLRDAKALDTFGRASADVTDAYITWALVSAGEKDLAREVAKSRRIAESTPDAYLLALTTATLLQHGASGDSSSMQAGRAAAARLAKMQDGAGAWTQADHSITRSGGLNLSIETTSLAVMALLKAEGHLENARKGVAWLQNNRGGFGQWGATQATVLALKAVMRFDEATRVAPRAGAVTLLVDGVPVAEQAFEAGRPASHGPLVFTGFDERLVPGKHRITLASKDGEALPYSIAVEYRSVEPASSDKAAVQLAATLAKADVKMGETVRMDAVVTNKTPRGLPMTLARLGLPGGLTFQNWQLKALREQGQIAFFETRAREVIVYFRDMKPGETKKIALDLVATVPGSYTGPASSAYLYYNDTDKAWAAPLPVRIAAQ